MKRFLTSLALKVGRYQMKFIDQVLTYKSKEDSSIVTLIDENSEKLIINAVNKKYPGSSLITEETGNILVDKSRYKFIVDPLDGTNNYFHRVPMFSVSIGVMVEEKLTYGIIYNPAMKELYYAEKNKGAYLNDKRIYVSRQQTLENGLFGTGFYYTKDEIILKKTLKQVFDVQRASLGVRRPGAASIDLAWTACGRYDAFWELGLNSWDMAAGILLVTEAGGNISKIDGKDFDLFGRNILASNGIVHQEMVKILN